MTAIRNISGVTVCWCVLALLFLGSGIAGKNIQTGSVLYWRPFEVVLYPILVFVMMLGFLGLERLFRPDIPWIRKWWLDWPRGVRELAMVFVVGCTAAGVGSLIRSIWAGLEAFGLALGLLTCAIAIWYALALWYRWFRPEFVGEVHPARYDDLL